MRQPGQTRLLAVGALAALAGVGTAAPAALAVPYDTATDALQLTLPATHQVSNLGATTEADELLTPTGPAYCSQTLLGATSDVNDGVKIVKTIWFRFASPGGSIDVDTAGSTVDTALAVYRSDATLALVACADDGPGGSDPATLRITGTAPGAVYYIAVGGCLDPLTHTACGGPMEGTVKIAVAQAPA
jgi:hypothetical protein